MNNGSASSSKVGGAVLGSLVLLGLAVLGNPAAMAQAEPSESCFRTAPPQDAVWVLSGAWTRAGLLLPDALARKIHRVDQFGAALEPVSVESTESEATLPENPSQVRSLPDGSFLVEDEKLEPEGIDELLRLDQGFEIIDRIAIKGRELSNGYQLSVLYDWAPWGEDGGVLAFGDLQRSDESWTSAFLFFDDLGNSHIFLELPTSSTASYLHSKEKGYLSVSGDTGYILLYEEEPTLLTVQHPGGGGNEVELVAPLGALPEEFRQRPEITTDSAWLSETLSPNKLTAYYRLVEQTSSFLQVIAWNDHTFLVARDVSSELRGSSRPGASTFWLIELDASGDEISRARLPVRPSTGHVVVVPGDDHWMVLEKKRVESMGGGEWDAPFIALRDMIFLPSSWFEDLGAGPLARRDVRCRNADR